MPLVIYWMPIAPDCEPDKQALFQVSTNPTWIGLDKNYGFFQYPVICVASGNRKFAESLRRFLLMPIATKRLLILNRRFAAPYIS